MYQNYMFIWLFYQKLSAVVEYTFLLLIIVIIIIIIKSWVVSTLYFCIFLIHCLLLKKTDTNKLCEHFSILHSNSKNRFLHRWNCIINANIMMNNFSRNLSRAGCWWLPALSTRWISHASNYRKKNASLIF